MKTNLILSVMFLAVFVSGLKAQNLSGQSGWQLTVEPRAVWAFDRTIYGETWLLHNNVLLKNQGLTFENAYGVDYDPVMSGTGRSPGWSVELSHRGKESLRTWGLSLWTSSSLTSASAVTSMPASADYYAGCRVFGHFFVPLWNDDEPSGFAKSYCGGSNRISFLELSAFMEQPLLLPETENGGLYLRLGLGAKRVRNERRTYFEENAVVHDYFGPGQDFYNEVRIGNSSNAETWMFGPSLGLRVRFGSPKLSFEVAANQSISASVTDAYVAWADTDRIHIRENGDIGTMAVFLNGWFDWNPTPTWGLSFPRDIRLSAGYRLTNAITARASVSCAGFGNLQAGAEWNAEIWAIGFGEGFQQKSQNFSYCSAGAGLRLRL